MILEDQIRRNVIDLFNIEEEGLTARSRKADYVYARKAFAYLLRRNTELTLTQIGSMLGGRDHASVIYMVNSAYDYMDVDKAFKKNIDYIQSILNLEEKDGSEIIKYVMNAIVWDEKGTTRKNLEKLFLN